MDKQRLIGLLTDYVPWNEQEEKDRALILRWIMTQPDAFSRENAVAHITVSAWVVNPSRTRVLMAWHNIYQSWSWLGGHADGDTDLPAVALREVREESGLSRVRLASPRLLSLESLTVDGHEKRGQYVSSHLHLNLTWLVEADDTEPLRVKPDENSAVAWFTPEEALTRSTEPWFVQRVYRKLNEKMITL